MSLTVWPFFWGGGSFAAEVAPQKRDFVGQWDEAQTHLARKTPPLDAQPSSRARGGASDGGAPMGGRFPRGQVCGCIQDTPPHGPVFSRARQRGQVEPGPPPSPHPGQPLGRRGPQSSRCAFPASVPPGTFTEEGSIQLAALLEPSGTGGQNARPLPGGLRPAASLRLASLAGLL